MPRTKRLSPSELPHLLQVPHIGVDEAGRGALAGPVVAAAAFFPPGFDFGQHLPGLDDSKKLSEHKRNTLAPLVRHHAIAFGLGLAWPLEIDAVNIVNATMRAMSRALGMLLTTLPVQTPFPALYIDGNLPLREMEWQAALGPARPSRHRPYLPLGLCLHAPPAQTPSGQLPRYQVPFPFIVQRAIIGGDGLVPTIAAASILAKVWRDTLMQRLAPRYPRYCLDQHKGYGTKTHMEAIMKNGPTPLHRQSFLKEIRPTETQLRLV